jgi:hypothetical protein
VPHAEIVRMHDFLAHAGRAGLEGFTAWAGVHEGERFMVRKTVIPRQTSRRTHEGLSVVIGPDELFLLNRWLYENNFTLIAQIHSHPTDAYHSELDDAIPIATEQGCFSIVVPDFAQSPFDLRQCAVFRLSAANNWDELSRRQADHSITIVHSWL